MALSSTMGRGSVAGLAPIGHSAVGSSSTGYKSRGFQFTADQMGSFASRTQREAIDEVKDVAEAVSGRVQANASLFGGAVARRSSGVHVAEKGGVRADESPTSNFSGGCSSVAQQPFPPGATAVKSR